MHRVHAGGSCHRSSMVAGSAALPSKRQYPLELPCCPLLLASAIANSSGRSCCCPSSVSQPSSVAPMRAAAALPPPGVAFLACLGFCSASAETGKKLVVLFALTAATAHLEWEHRKIKGPGLRTSRRDSSKGAAGDLGAAEQVGGCHAPVRLRGRRRGGGCAVFPAWQCLLECAIQLHARALRNCLQAGQKAGQGFGHLPQMHPCASPLRRERFQSTCKGCNCAPAAGCCWGSSPRP